MNLANLSLVHKSLCPNKPKQLYSSLFGFVCLLQEKSKQLKYAGQISGSARRFDSSTKALKLLLNRNKKMCFADTWKHYEPRCKRRLTCIIYICLLCASVGQISGTLIPIAVPTTVCSTKTTKVSYLEVPLAPLLSVAVLLIWILFSVF